MSKKRPAHTDHAMRSDMPDHDETPDPRTVVIIGGVVYDGEEGL